MSIKKLSTLILILSASFAQAKEMSDEARHNLRAYLNSAHLESPSSDREQRYGASLLYDAPLPFDNFGLGVLMNINPDTIKKSGEVNVLEHFTSANPFLRFDLVYLLRFSALVGPGLLYTKTKYNVLDTVDSHSQFSFLGFGALAVDYAVTDQWEISWLLQAQYRFAHQKWDWINGLGVAFNF